MHHSGKRAPAYYNARLGCDEEGYITALEFDVGLQSFVIDFAILEWRNNSNGQTGKIFKTCRHEEKGLNGEWPFDINATKRYNGGIILPLFFSSVYPCNHRQRLILSVFKPLLKKRRGNYCHAAITKATGRENCRPLHFRRPRRSVPCRCTENRFRSTKTPHESTISFKKRFNGLS